MKQPEAVSYLERLRVSSARVECWASASLSLGRSHSTYKEHGRLAAEPGTGLFYNLFIGLARILYGYRFSVPHA